MRCIWRCSSLARRVSSGCDVPLSESVALITQPKGSMSGAAQVILEACGLGDRCRLGERDDQHACVVWVLQASEQSPNSLRNLTDGALDLAVVALRGVEQQQCVARRRGIEHDDRVLCRVDCASEGAEHRDLLGARRPQVLFQQRTTVLVELPGAGQHLG